MLKNEMMITQVPKTETYPNGLSDSIESIPMAITNAHDKKIDL